MSNTVIKNLFLAQAIHETNI